MALDIDECHLLRLGHGEKELDTEKVFSRLGRVDHMLELRWGFNHRYNVDVKEDS